MKITRAQLEKYLELSDIMESFCGDRFDDSRFFKALVQAHLEALDLLGKANIALVRIDCESNPFGLINVYLHKHGGIE